MESEKDGVEVLYFIIIIMIMETTDMSHMSHITLAMHSISIAKWKRYRYQMWWPLQRWFPSLSKFSVWKA